MYIRGGYTQAVGAFLAPVAVAPFDRDATSAYGTLRALLEARGTTVGIADTMIAAHALATGRSSSPTTSAISRAYLA